MVTPQNLPTVASNIVPGDLAWANPNNILAMDTNYATATTASAGTFTTQNLSGTGFGFAIGSAARIDGIEVDIVRKASDDTALKWVADGIGVVLVKEGGGTSSARTDASHFATIDEQIVYGGSSDLWGTTWTAADIVGSNFGFRYRTTLQDTFGTVITAYINVVLIRVTYTQPSITGVQSITAISTITF